ncbi:CPBP family intramembrane metalloprotease [Nocardia sp. 2]|uniref:CPBP family intramembrane metalloprotease n=1 Tax=Nocardia acididurans TaxID=2802282 RepID=A0ABS1M9G7_9NOCA|nr:type II CAAX endopeptidase family protein [Nocardia acididurans]MBL1077287.1 CPBP family intramembrane metalloprotease [Nocardia acididurans]
MVDEQVRERPVAVANPVGVTAFLMIAFGVSWAWLLCAVVWLGFSVVNPIVQLPMGMAPAMAAVVVRRWVTGEGFADSGSALRFRENRRWFAAAWLGPVGLTAASFAVAVAAGVWHVDWGVPALGLLPVLLIAVIVLMPIYWGEEFGWTSYLRPRLFPGRPLASVVATGLIWAVWHFPLAFVGYVHFGNTAVGLAIWTVSFLGQEVILAWLYLRSGSIWTASLAHAGNNMVLSLLIGELMAERVGDTMVTALLGAPIAAVAVWLVATGRLGRAAAAAESTR